MGSYENRAGVEGNYIGDIARISESMVSAQTGLDLGNWSPDYLHGPDVIAAVCHVIEKLLEGGESISGIRNLRFLKLMTSDLTIFASSNGSPAPVGCENCEPSVVGSFVTTNGRLLDIACYQTGARVTKRNEADDSLRVLRESMTISGYSFGDGIEWKSFRLQSSSSHLQKNLGQNVRSFLEEAILIAATFTGSGFLGGVEDVNLPKLDESIRECSVQATFDPARRKFTRGGFVISPIKLDFGFCGSDGWHPIGGGVVTMITGSQEACESLFKKAGIELRPAPLFI